MIPRAWIVGAVVLLVLGAYGGGRWHQAHRDTFTAAYDAATARHRTDSTASVARVDSFARDTLAIVRLRQQVRAHAAADVQAELRLQSARAVALAALDSARRVLADSTATRTALRAELAQVIATGARNDTLHVQYEATLRRQLADSGAVIAAYARAQATGVRALASMQARAVDAETQRDLVRAELQHQQRMGTLERVAWGGLAVALALR